MRLSISLRFSGSKLLYEVNTVSTSRSLEGPQPYEQIFKSAYHSMRARWANDHDVARLQAKTIPKNLIWSEWAPVVAEFRRPQDSRSPYRAHGHANYTSMEKHDLHIYMPRRFQWTWFGMHRPIGCWVMASARFQEPLSWPWACPFHPQGQITMTLHTYRPRRFKWAWYGVNRPSDCGRV